MIGIFDSGLGGLTIAKEVIHSFPSYHFLYFGDTANLPYGLKSKCLVKKYSEEAIDWMQKRGVDLVIIACHTSSCLAGDYLKGKFRFPILDMVASTIKAGAESTRNGKIGIIGTPATIKSGVYQKKLQEKNSNFEIYSQACPLLVPLVEEGRENQKTVEKILQRYLLPFKPKNIDTLILGCTHYPLLEKTIQKIVGKNVRLINPAVGIVQTLELLLRRNMALNLRLKKGDSINQFFFSSYPYNVSKISKKCLGKEIIPEIISLSNN